MKLFFIILGICAFPVLFFLAAAKYIAWRSKILFTGGKKPSATSINKNTWNLTDEDLNSN